MTPRKFYLGFGPPIVKVTRGGVEYGIGALPLGGYVKIPGMSRPSPGDLKATLPPRGCEGRTRRAGTPRRCDRARRPRRGAHRARGAASDRRRDARWSRSSTWSLEPDAYWRQATWRRLVAIGAGPGVNLLFAFVLFTGAVHGRDERARTSIGARRGRLARRGRRRARGRPDRVRRRGRAVKPDDIAHAHPRHERHGRSGSSSTASGRRVVIGPTRARRTTAPTASGSRSRPRRGRASHRRPPPRTRCRSRGQSPPTPSRGLGAPRHRPRHEPGLELGRDRPASQRRRGGRGCATSCSCSGCQPRARAC